MYAGRRRGNEVVGKVKIRNWKQFARRVRSNGCRLLSELDRFPDAVLVTGCQRSGTTMLARTIARSPSISTYHITKDDELDAALILSGYVDYPSRGRYCFQTTYVNECYGEYYEKLADQSMIWLIRNPYSVVYSMCVNWGSFAREELYRACGAPVAAPSLKGGFWARRLARRVMKACSAYNGKYRQLFELYERMPRGRLCVLDYDQLIYRKHDVVRGLFDRLGLAYVPGIEGEVHSNSAAKADRLAPEMTAYVEKTCATSYERARKLVEPWAGRLEPESFGEAAR